MDGRNGVNFDVVNATPLPAVQGPEMRQTQFGAKCITAICNKTPLFRTRLGARTTKLEQQLRGRARTRHRQRT
ncbi:hypothetical protein PIB30_052309 [Stylosanthes scabra]|uniref:Uncharacterized protein n=1 Tax=Stylosanthes scabra TaxID=79078 RepID=A0ABU6TJ13_9FABA|nr:hypothetical protein [Stylosanthes scabra]